MHSIKRIALTPCLLFLSFPVVAQTASPEREQVANPASAETQDAHADLFNAMQEEVDTDVILANALASARREYLNLPEFAQAERESPGFVDDIIAGIAPVLAQVMERNDAAFQREVTALYRRSLSNEEASELAGLFRTPIVRRFMNAVSRSYLPNAVLEDIDSKDPITAAQVDQDIQSAATTAADEFSEAERNEFVQTLSRSRAWDVYRSIRDEILTLRTKIENSPLTPQEELAMTTAIDQVVESRFGK